jgi:hypothetical protein
VEKYGRVRQVTDDNITVLMRIVRLITMATYTHSEYVIFLLFYSNNGYANAFQIYVTRTLPVFLHFTNKRSLLIINISISF